MNGISVLLESCGSIPKITQEIRSRDGIGNTHLLHIILFSFKSAAYCTDQLLQYIVFIRRRERKGKTCKPNILRV